MRRFAVLLAVTALCAGCMKAPESPEKTMDEPEKFTEIPEQSISFVRIHPNAPQKNTYIDWKYVESSVTHQRSMHLDGKDISEEAQNALAELISSADEDLIESDGIYACHYHEKQPQNRISFIKNNKKYFIVSSSDCLNNVPMNIQIDGKWHIQLSGRTGKALQKAIQAAGSSLNIEGQPSMLMLDRPVSLKGIEASGDHSPRAYYDAEIRKKSEPMAEFAKAAEEVFGVPMIPDIACNQAKSSDCSDVFVKYAIHPAAGAEYAVTGSLSAFPQIADTGVYPEYPGLKQQNALKSWMTEYPIVHSYMKVFGGADNPVEILWKPGYSQTLSPKIAKYFRDETPKNKHDETGFDSWGIRAKGKPVMMLYRDRDIHAVWLESSAEMMPVIQDFCALPKLPSETKKRICTKLFVLDSSVTLFIGKDSSAVMFKKDGDVTVHVK